MCSILNCIFCNAIIGIIAIIFSVKAREDFNAGKFEDRECIQPCLCHKTIHFVLFVEWDISNIEKNLAVYFSLLYLVTLSQLKPALALQWNTFSFGSNRPVLVSLSPARHVKWRQGILLQPGFELMVNAANIYFDDTFLSIFQVEWQVEEATLT